MEESSQLKVNIDIASDNQQELGLSHNDRGDEINVGQLKEDAPVTSIPLMEQVVNRDNLLTALHNVQRNKGCAGIDGLTIDDLPAFLGKHWLDIKTQLLNGSYRPQAVKHV